MIDSKQLANFMCKYIERRIDEEYPLSGNWGSLYYWEEPIEKLFQESIDSYIMLQNHKRLENESTK